MVETEAQILVLYVIPYKYHEAIAKCNICIRDLIYATLGSFVSEIFGNYKESYETKLANQLPCC